MTGISAVLEWSVQAQAVQYSAGKMRGKENNNKKSKKKLALRDVI